MGLVNKSEVRRILEAALTKHLRVAAFREGTEALEATLEGFGRLYPVQLYWAGQGWPGEVRARAPHFDRAGAQRAVIVARRFSPGAVAWLEERAANYADATGRVRLVTPDGLVFIREPTGRDDKRAPQTERETSFSWSAGRADVAEVILAERRVPAIRDLARQASLDIGFVSRTLVRFDRLGWTEKHGPARGRRAGRRLRDEVGLRESWAEHLRVAPREAIRAHVLSTDPLEYLERELVPALRHLGPFAVSGWAGVQLVAPYMTTVPTLHAYVAQEHFGDPLRALLRGLRAREVSDGERLVFSPARAPALAHPLKGRSAVPVVHAARLYADLLALGERGQSAAEHVRSELLGGQ